MSRFELTDHFYLDEFVPRKLVQVYGNNARWFVSDWQIIVAEFIREYFGGRPMTINNWYRGGRLHNRGTRTPNTTVGSLYSQHKLAMAIDFSIKELSSPEIYDRILADQKSFLLMGITTMEHIAFTPTWIHIDGRNTGLDELFIVRPRKI
jgi:hypothetical protein